MKKISRNLRKMFAGVLFIALLSLILIFTGFLSSSTHTFHIYDLEKKIIVSSDSYWKGSFYGFSMFEFYGTWYRSFVEEVKADNVFSFCFTNGPKYLIDDMRIKSVSGDSIDHLDGTHGITSFVDSNGIINFLTILKREDGSQMVVRFNRDGRIMETLDFSEYGFKILNLNAYDENSIFLLIKDIDFKIIRYDASSNIEVVREFISNSVIIDFHIMWEDSRISNIFLLEQNPNAILTISNENTLQLESELNFKPFDLAFDGSDLVIHQKH